MLEHHRLRAIRICQLVASVVVMLVTASVLRADAEGIRAAISSEHSWPASASGHPGSAGKHTRASRSRCTAAKRAGKHRKAGKPCATRSKRAAAQPGVTRSPTGPQSSPSSPVVSSTASATGAGADEAGGGAAPPSEDAGSPPAETIAPSEPVAPLAPPAPFRFFSHTSFWNEPVPAESALDPNSTALVGALDEEITSEEKAKGGAANINTTAWSVPIYTVPAGEPTVTVTLRNASQSPALQSAWDAVPLPADAEPAAGSDKHLVVWQPSSERLWEFWGLAHETEGWEASWGGAMQSVSSNSGAYGPEAWPGAQRGWGASASSLSIAGGLITLEDLQTGQINHALAMALPNVRERVYASPAERTDGSSTSPLSLPEGAHLRLDPNLDLAALHLPRLTLMIAEAAQRYGIFVRDRAGDVTFYGQDPIPTGSEPYTGAHGYFEGKSPGQLLASFPWSHLQVLKMSLHSTS